MKINSFVRVSLGEQGCRVTFGRKATEAKGHREVTQYGCFGDGVSEATAKELIELLTPTQWEGGQEDEIFLSGRIALEFEVEGDAEAYEVPEDYVPEDLKTVVVYTTPVKIIGCGEPQADVFTALARERVKSGGKPTVLKSNKD